MSTEKLDEHLCMPLEKTTSLMKQLAGLQRAVFDMRLPPQREAVSSTQNDAQRGILEKNICFMKYLLLRSETNKPLILGTTVQQFQNLIRLNF